MARRSLKLAAVGALVLAAVVGTFAVRRALGTRLLPVAVASKARAPEGVRVRVQIINTTSTRGLARRATQLLRDRGFDVVESGTGAESMDSTLVLDRSGHPDWARRVAAALGGARVEARPDSSRYLDVTVLLGRSWRAPTEPFYP